MNQILFYIARFAVLMLILPAHELAHAYAAYKNGDPTAKAMGRMTLNPFAHFDALGLVSFLLIGFGWAKPVPINPNNFHNYKKGCFWVSVAGIITNYLLAFAFYPLYFLANKYLPAYTAYGFFFRNLFYSGFVLDLSFFAFNIIPVYPLDGFRLLDTFVKRRNKAYFNYRRFGYYALLGLMLLSFVANKIPALSFLDIFGYFMTFAIKYLGYPITELWNALFKLIFG